MIHITKSRSTETETVTTAKRILIDQETQLRVSTASRGKLTYQLIWNRATNTAIKSRPEELGGTSLRGLKVDKYRKAF